MHLIGISIVVQLLCAVHCVRNGRNSLWLMVIIFLSIPGCLAYAFFEIFPQYAQRREVRAVKSAAVRKLDPERGVRTARDALDLADTAANRIRLGDALADAGKTGDAVPEYEAALAKAPNGDRATQFKLARVLLDSGSAGRARELLATLPPSGSASENDRAKLLLAQAAEECGDPDQALSLYEEVAERLPGAEPQCRRAALLLKEGRRDEALEVLTEVERLAKRLDRFEKTQNPEMYGWAERTLAELRVEHS